MPLLSPGPTAARATPRGGTASLVARSRLHRSMIRLSGAGALRARGLGGTRLDLLQWAAVGAILGALVGLFLLIAITRAAA